MIHGRQAGLWLLAAALVPMAAFAQPDSGRCEFRDTRELNGPAAGTLEVKSGAGAVEILGETGLAEVRVAAILCASSQELLDGLSVSLDEGRLATHYPREGAAGGAGGGATTRAFPLRCASRPTPLLIWKTPPGPSRCLTAPAPASQPDGVGPGRGRIRAPARCVSAGRGRSGSRTVPGASRSETSRAMSRWTMGPAVSTCMRSPETCW